MEEIQTMDRKTFIDEMKRLIEAKEITDIESYVYEKQASRTKAKKDLQGEEWEGVQIRKHTLYIKK